jgi:hypothetical protein
MTEALTEDVYKPHEVLSDAVQVPPHDGIYGKQKGQNLGKNKIEIEPGDPEAGKLQHKLPTMPSKQRSNGPSADETPPGLPSTPVSDPKPVASKLRKHRILSCDMPAKKMSKGTYVEPAEAPEVAVSFRLKDGSVLSTHYHRVLVTDEVVVLVYDSRFKIGARFRPPSASLLGNNIPTIRIGVHSSEDGTDEVYSVLYVGVEFNFEHYDFMIMIRTADEEAGGDS